MAINWGKHALWARLLRGPKKNHPVIEVPSAEQPDRHLPGLSVARAEAVRQELAHEFEARGFEVRFDRADVILTKPGKPAGPELILDLTPLAEGLRADSSPQAVASWAAQFVNAAFAVNTVPDLSTAEIYQMLRLVLLPALPADGRPPLADHEYIPDEDDAADARLIRQASYQHFSDDLLACFVYDTGVAITPADTEHLAEIDDIHTLARIGRKHLAAELSAADVTANYHQAMHGLQGGGCWVLTSDSPYLSAAPLVMEEFLLHHLPELNTDDGVLFAVPQPDFLLVAEVATGPELGQDLHVLAAAAVGLASTDSTDITLSPRLHLWHGGHVETVSEIIEEEASFVITPGDYLTERLRAEQD